MSSITPMAYHGLTDSAFVEQARRLREGIPSSVAGSLIIGTIMALVLWDVLPSGNAQTWITIFAAIQLSRMVLWRAWLGVASDKAARRWRVFLRVSAFVVGATWGAIPVFLFPPDLAHQVLLPFVAAGITGAAVASYAPDRVSATLFIVSVLAPLFVRLVTTGGDVSLAMSVMVLLYLAYLLATAYRSDLAFREIVAARAAANEQKEELRASEERYRVIYTESREAIVTLEPPSWRFTSGNDSAIRLFGANNEAELVKYGPGDVSPAFQPDGCASPDKAREMIETAMREGSHYFEWQHQRLDGQEFPATVLMTCMKIGAQLLLQASVRDISEKKQAERALANHSRFMQALVDNIPGRIAYWTNELLCDFANGNYCEWFQRTPENIRGSHMREVLGENLFSKNQPYIEAVLCGNAQHFERTTTMADGSTGCIWVHYSPHIQDARVCGFFVLVSDITEIKAAQARLERMNAELQTAREDADQANQAKSSFLSSMSHELRTPMNAILGFGQLMSMDASLSDENQDYLKEILKGGRHLLELINEVLDLAKVESGRIELSLEPVEVDPLTSECVSLVASLASARDIDFSHSGLKHAVVRADYTRLKQVVLNLLSNAIKYNREGGRVEISVEATSEDSVRIRVADTGPGIPAARLDEVFQPFNRLGAEGTNIEGTGIGLTITRQIVELMGGKIHVESEVGVGSAFWIELPKETMATASDATEAAAGIGETSQGGQTEKQFTVLYIEDNPANLRLVVQILGLRKHVHILTAHTPGLGIDLARAHSPDLILLDINMPDMDGYQVLKTFQEDDSLKSVPVIAVTANAMPRDITRGKEAGFSDYVTKPIDIPKFLGTVDRYLV